MVLIHQNLVQNENYEIIRILKLTLKRILTDRKLRGLPWTSLFETVKNERIRLEQRCHFL